MEVGHHCGFVKLCCVHIRMSGGNKPLRHKQGQLTGVTAGRLLCGELEVTGQCGRRGTADLAPGTRSWRSLSVQELCTFLVRSLGPQGSGPALSFIKSRLTKAPSMVPIGQRVVYRKQRSWLRTQLMLSRTPSYGVAAKVKSYSKHMRGKSRRMLVSVET